MTSASIGTAFFVNKLSALRDEKRRYGQLMLPAIRTNDRFSVRRANGENINAKTDFDTH
jgi:hypothetical protein